MLPTLSVHRSLSVSNVWNMHYQPKELWIIYTKRDRIYLHLYHYLQSDICDLQGNIWYQEKKKSQHVWNFLLILKGTLSHSHKENWALSGNFKRYFVMNMVLSIKENCIFFPTICGSNSDTRMSTNVDGCDAFHFCNRWINCNTDSTGVEQSAGGAGFLEGGEWENI